MILIPHDLDSPRNWIGGDAEWTSAPKSTHKRKVLFRFARVNLGVTSLNMAMDRVRWQTSDAYPSHHIPRPKALDIPLVNARNTYPYAQAPFPLVSRWGDNKSLSSAHGFRGRSQRGVLDFVDPGFQLSVLEDGKEVDG